MKPFVALLSALIVLVFAPPLSLANVVDRSVAIVNEDTITLSEVNEAGKPFSRKSPRKHLPTR